ncbi:winged helix-turn-helix transcriptional regulator [Candidatus Woesearchaeota archaeon]|nr:winged helix-turn-helix transcriptional regulator [Candidatus Woesearchaeota archaeon]
MRDYFIKIFDLLNKDVNRGKRISGISDTLKIPYSVAKSNIQKMERRGILTTRRVNDHNLYFLSAGENQIIRNSQTSRSQMPGKLFFIFSFIVVILVLVFVAKTSLDKLFSDYGNYDGSYIKYILSFIVVVFVGLLVIRPFVLKCLEGCAFHEKIKKHSSWYVVLLVVLAAGCIILGNYFIHQNFPPFSLSKEINVLRYSNENGLLDSFFKNTNISSAYCYSNKNYGYLVINDTVYCNLNIEFNAPYRLASITGYPSDLDILYTGKDEYLNISPINIGFSKYHIGFLVPKTDYWGSLYFNINLNNGSTLTKPVFWFKINGRPMTEQQYNETIIKIRSFEWGIISLAFIGMSAFVYNLRKIVEGE